MKITSFGLTAALLASLTAVPAFAQERNAQRREAARAQHEAQHESQRQAQPQREAAPRANPAAPPARNVEQAQPRRQEPNRVAPPAVAPRVETRSNEVVGRAVPRTAQPYNGDRANWEREHGYANRNDDHRYYGSAHRYYSYAPRVYAPRTVIVPRPYVFRPHLSIGFGIFAGYPVPYSWRYAAPIYVYGYSAPPAPVYVTPGMPAYGGIALEISPPDADVFVDG